jgi:hypothetical protein
MVSVTPPNLKALRAPRAQDPAEDLKYERWSLDRTQLVQCYVAQDMEETHIRNN